MSSTPSTSAWARLVQKTKRASSQSSRPAKTNNEPTTTPVRPVSPSAIMRKVIKLAGEEGTPPSPPAGAQPLRRRFAGPPGKISVLARQRLAAEAAESLRAPEEDDIYEDFEDEEEEEEDERAQSFSSPRRFTNEDDSWEGTVTEEKTMDNAEVAAREHEQLLDFLEVRGRAGLDAYIASDASNLRTGDNNCLMPSRSKRERPVQNRDGVAETSHARDNVSDTDDNATTTSSPTNCTRHTNIEAADHSPAFSSLGSGFRSRQKMMLGKGIDRLQNEDVQNQRVMSVDNDVFVPKDDTAANAGATTRPSSRSPPSTVGLREGSESTLNRSPKGSVSLPQQPDATQLATPASSQSSSSYTTIAADDDTENTPLDTLVAEQLPKRKPKRRLTLHHEPAQRALKKRRTTPPQKTTTAAVQTTLALSVGSSAGMRECKVCDTVYNPFNSQDVRVHKTRHVAVVRRERAEAAELERLEDLGR